MTQFDICRRRPIEMGGWVVVEAEEQEWLRVNAGEKSFLRESHSNSKKENLCDETGYSAHKEDLLGLRSHHAWQPEGGEGCHGDEGLGFLLCGILVAFCCLGPIFKIASWFYDLAEVRQSAMIGGVADDKGWEYKRAGESRNEHEEDEIGHSDEEHPRPDAQDHCRQLRVWVGLVFRPQNQV